MVPSLEAYLDGEAEVAPFQPATPFAAHHLAVFDEHKTEEAIWQTKHSDTLFSSYRSSVKRRGTRLHFRLAKAPEPS